MQQRRPPPGRGRGRPQLPGRPAAIPVQYVREVKPMDLQQLPLDANNQVIHPPGVQLRKGSFNVEEHLQTRDQRVECPHNMCCTRCGMSIQEAEAFQRQSQIAYDLEHQRQGNTPIQGVQKSGMFHFDTRAHPKDPK